MLKIVAILLVAMQLGSMNASDPYTTPKKSGSSKKGQKSPKKSSAKQATPKKEIKEGWVKLVKRVDGMAGLSKDQREVLIQDIKALKQQAQGKNEGLLKDLLKRAKKEDKKKLEEEEGVAQREASVRKQEAVRLEAQKAAERRRAESDELRIKEEERCAAQEDEDRQKQAETASDTSESLDGDDDEVAEESKRKQTEDFLWTAFLQYNDAPSNESRGEAAEGFNKAIEEAIAAGSNAELLKFSLQDRIESEKDNKDTRGESLRSLAAVFEKNKAAKSVVDELVVAITAYKDANEEDRADAKLEVGKAIQAEIKTGVAIKRVYERVKTKISAEKPDLEITLKSLEDVFKANGLILDEVKDSGSGDKGEKVPVGSTKDDKVSKPLLERFRTKKGIATLIAAAIAGYLGYNYAYLRMKNKKTTVTVK